MDRKSVEDKIKRHLAELSDTADRAVERLKETTGESRERIRAKVHQLKEKQGVLREMLAEIERTGEDAWKNFPAEVDRAWEDVQQVAKDLARFVRGEPRSDEK